jgi:hypothetical protein
MFGKPFAGGRGGNVIRTVPLPGGFSTGGGGSVMRTVSFFGSFNEVIESPIPLSGAVLPS